MLQSYKILQDHVSTLTPLGFSLKALVSLPTYQILLFASDPPSKASELKGQAEGLHGSHGPQEGCFLLNGPWPTALWWLLVATANVCYRGQVKGFRIY